MRKIKTIKVTLEVWRELQNIRIKKDYKTLNDVIKHLLENYKKSSQSR